ncbi:MAG: hypothetical protein HUJ88_11570, partial [Fusobacterium necrophorum]|nr:hypothetical protein [Fusobacterium necrophorum]
MGRLISCCFCGKIHKSDVVCQARKKSISRRQYKEKRNDTAIYEDKRWRKVRQNILEDCYGLCLWAYYVQGRAVKADCVHHIVEVLKDESRCFDENNLIALSHENHIMIHKDYYNNKYKKNIQLLLLDMKDCWQKGEKELGSFKNKR